MNMKSKGFSLIEMLVAMVILGLSLGILYQASAGATRNVRLDERYTYAVQIAQSLLADYPQMPPGGINSSGVAGDDYHWELNSTALAVDEALPQSLMLYRVDVVVTWEGDNAREVALTTVVPEMTEQADIPVENPDD